MPRDFLGAARVKPELDASSSYPSGVDLNLDLNLTLSSTEDNLPPPIVTCPSLNERAEGESPPAIEQIITRANGADLGDEDGQRVEDVNLMVNSTTQPQGSGPMSEPQAETSLGPEIPRGGRPEEITPPAGEEGPLGGSGLIGSELTESSSKGKWAGPEEVDLNLAKVSCMQAFLGHNPPPIYSGSGSRVSLYTAFEGKMRELVRNVFLDVVSSDTSLADHVEKLKENIRIAKEN